MSLENGSSSASKTSALTPEEVSNALESQDFSLSLLETIQLESGRAEIFPLYGALDDQATHRSDWLTRYDFTFARYLPFYRFKKKVEASTPAEMDECVAKIDSLSLKEKAYVLTALYIYEREKRVRPKEELDSHAAQRNEIEEYICDRESKGFYVPAYVRSPYFYGNPIDVLLPYEPNEAIDAATWKRWTEIYRRYGNNEETAIEPFRPEEPNNVKYRRQIQNRSSHDRESATGLFAEWLADLDLCAKLVKDNLGFDVAENYFTYQSGGEMKTWESEFSHHYVYCCPVKPIDPSASPDDLRMRRYEGSHEFRLNENSSSLFMENFLKGIENIEHTDQSCKDVMVALRDYWFTTQLLPPKYFAIGGASGSFWGPYSGNSSDKPLTLRDVSLFILERRCFYADLKNSLSDSEIAKAEATLNEALAVAEEYSTDGSLLETIRRAASESEIFPIFTFAYPSLWYVHFENTLERYLPFYFFKTKVGSSSPQEIEECIDVIDELNSKEKAFVLTAVLIYERAKRKRLPEVLESEQWAHEKLTNIWEERRKNGRYVPKFVDEPYYTDTPNDLLFSPYEPDESIDETTWSRWIDVIKRYVDDQTVAFSAFRPNELAPEENAPYELTNINDLSKKENFQRRFLVSLDDCNLAKEWIDNLRFCSYVVQKYLKLDESSVQLRSPSYLTAFSVGRPFEINSRSCCETSEDRYIMEFYKGIDEYDPARPETKLLYALRDYCVTFQLSLSYHDDDLACQCNTSAFPRSLGEIAAYILNRRKAISTYRLEPYRRFKEYEKKDWY